jgi:hypothetical protein
MEGAKHQFIKIKKSFRRWYILCPEYKNIVHWDIF